MTKTQGEKKWFAIYTKPRSEKKVFEQLVRYNFEAFLPLKKEIHRWKDRLKKVEVPLFNSYVFVKVDESEYYELPKRNIQGFLKYVTIGGKRVEVRQKEIDLIKKILANTDNVEVLNENLDVGDAVKIKRGAFRGLTGRLVEIQGSKKFAVSIDSLKTNLLVEVNINAIEKIA